MLVGTKLSFLWAYFTFSDLRVLLSDILGIEAVHAGQKLTKI